MGRVFVEFAVGLLLRPELESRSNPILAILANALNNLRGRKFGLGFCLFFELLEQLAFDLKRVDSHTHHCLSELHELILLLGLQGEYMVDQVDHRRCLHHIKHQAHLLHRSLDLLVLIVLFLHHCDRSHQTL